jgi:hypothetical protein
MMHDKFKKADKIAPMSRRIPEKKVSQDNTKDKSLL